MRYFDVANVRGVPHARSYETVGYCIRGSATLDIGGTVRSLRAGDAYVVPAGALHTWRIDGAFEAVEACSPLEFIHDRDAAVGKQAQPHQQAQSQQPQQPEQ